MELKEYVKQYKNDELCKKWGNNIPSHELDIFFMCATESDIDSVIESFPFLSDKGITGALLRLGDGDYTEVYVTESSHPVSLDAIYHPLDYYL